MLDEAGANRVVEDVAAGFLQILVAFDQTGIEPFLKEVARSAVASVEPTRVWAVQGVHSA